ATVPTEHNMRLLERYKIRVQQAREAKIADLKVLAEQIQRVSVTIEANANDEGHLYGSVGPAEISKALRGRNLPVDAEMVKMEGQIKELGLYEVKLNLGYDIESAVKVLAANSTKNLRPFEPIPRATRFHLENGSRCVRVAAWGVALARLAASVANDDRTRSVLGCPSKTVTHFPNSGPARTAAR